jgi:hypothetical protein
MNLVKMTSFIVLLCLIFTVAFAIETVRKGDQQKLDTLCKNGIDIPIAKGAIMNKGLLVYPSEDTSFHIDLGC